MANKYGYPEASWDKCKEEMTSILKERASRRETIFYGDLSLSLKEICLDPHGAAMADMLGQVSIEEDRAGRGMLSVIVVSKQDWMPGRGFFKCAASLGKDVADQVALWSSESNKVFETWGRNS